MAIAARVTTPIKLAQQLVVAGGDATELLERLTQK